MPSVHEADPGQADAPALPGVRRDLLAASERKHQTVQGDPLSPRRVRTPALDNWRQRKGNPVFIHRRLFVRYSFGQTFSNFILY